MARLALIFDELQNAYNENWQRQDTRRVARYSEKAFAMSDEEFVKNYRMDKNAFQILCDDLEPLMKKPKRRSEISPKFKILVALSFYATGSYQRLIGETRGTMMAQQTVSKAVDKVTTALNSIEITQKWVKFPQTRQERDLIKRRFYEKFRIPSVCGCIDGTHIALIKPTEHEERFYNRKGYDSRNVLIICNADLNILSVDPSFGGATHDTFIWNQHPVKENLRNLNNEGERIFLLGDSGYPQREYLMTPIINAPQGSPEEHYTKLQCKARNTVERTIGVLKNKWRFLLRHRVLHYHPDKAAKIINACCVLHNMCNKARIQDESVVNIDGEQGLQEAQVADPASPELRRGIEARARLSQQLWAARRLHRNRY